METQVTEIAPDIYRLSTYLSDADTVRPMPGTACRRCTTWRTPMTSG